MLHQENSLKLISYSIFTTCLLDNVLKLGDENRFSSFLITPLNTHAKSSRPSDFFLCSAHTSSRDNLMCVT